MWARSTLSLLLILREQAFTHVQTSSWLGGVLSGFQNQPSCLIIVTNNQPHKPLRHAYGALKLSNFFIKTEG